MVSEHADSGGRETSSSFRFMVQSIWLWPLALVRAWRYNFVLVRRGLSECVASTFGFRAVNGHSRQTQ